MISKSPRFLLSLAAAFVLNGCATQTSSLANRTKLASVRSVAVNYASTGGRGDSTGGRVAGRVARHGAGFALGQLGFVGGLIGLAVDVVDIATPSSGETKISGPALTLLREAGTEPLALVAQQTEREIARRRLFALTNANPDAIFDLELRRLQIDPVDSRGLNQRATLAVNARLVDRKGGTLWQKSAAATSARVRSAREYSEQPRLVRADFDSLAATVSRHLLAEMRGSPR